MYQTKERTIDDLKVTVTEWPARKAFKMKVRLLKIFGPVLAEIISGMKSKAGASVLDSDFDLSKFGSAIEKLTATMSEDDLLKMVFELTSSTRINNQEITEDTFDMVFAGKMHTIYKILGMVLEVNFGSFLGMSGIGKVFQSTVMRGPSVPQAS